MEVDLLQIIEFQENGLRSHSRAEFPYILLAESFICSTLDQRYHPSKRHPTP